MTLIPFVILALIVFVALAYGVAIYNGLVAVKNNIDKAWANIDVLLKQRHDEIPKLIKVCEGYMVHERGVIDQVLKARDGLMAVHAQPAKAGAAESALRGAMGKLFALAEAYPDLKAQASFQQLQQRISSLESDIADRREFYNDSVNTYNIRIESFPDMIVARWMLLAQREMFKIEASDRQDVEIKFSHPLG
ncbi:MAG TPA: LemA family protein [Bdellovibrionales bacterium]|nr:MAG: LemA family protein [Bdellovibrionales bacterium GWB1_52_6]OFZ04093.1 MAG: LemA family protein [Bdellovibrionales bacterium GWA1_52_35]OFZ35735.1 MAG: LemA family protein [Bdellovibrionales bacterium GWC1_52_8]HAR41371.1 LemA family protein [Bdellovibrionales bacterium]HCM39821.1 LemA family protein [Bdellovibrionales bacterium]